MSNKYLKHGLATIKKAYGAYDNRTFGFTTLRDLYTRMGRAATSLSQLPNSNVTGGSTKNMRNSKYSRMPAPETINNTITNTHQTYNAGTPYDQNWYGGGNGSPNNQGEAGGGRSPAR